MPEIWRSYGIVITFNYDDHLLPNFHARYSECRALVAFDGSVVTGGLPPRALQLIISWTALHREELLSDWELARFGRPLRPIEPLD